MNLLRNRQQIIIGARSYNCYYYHCQNRDDWRTPHHHLPSGNSLSNELIDVIERGHLRLDYQHRFSISSNFQYFGSKHCKYLSESFAWHLCCRPLRWRRPTSYIDLLGHQGFLILRFLPANSLHGLSGLLQCPGLLEILINYLVA